MILKKAEIKISGMHCASCALNVEKSLNDLEGVDEAKVNFGTEKATVNMIQIRLNCMNLKILWKVLDMGDERECCN